jgi:hypothetical protein
MSAGVVQAGAPAALIDRIPPPLLRDIVASRCLPIIGAGFSRDAEVTGPRQLPLWRELGEQIAADLMDDPASTDPVEAISAYAQEYGRVRLIEELRARLHHGIARPGPAQLEFCQLPFDVVCTTNWDTLLERAYETVERPYYVILEEHQLPIGVDRGAVTLVKLHGDLDHPNRLVASETDYDSFLQENPLLVTYVANLLITRTPLFIGYSLDDPDFRQIMSIVNSRLGRLTRVGYALTHGVTAQQRNRFERRNVRCIDVA